MNTQNQEMTFSISHLKSHINGKWVEGESGFKRKILNPANNLEVVAEGSEVSAAQVSATCTAAANAYPGWRSLPPSDRARYLYKFRDLLEKNFAELTRLLVKENGKLTSEARGDIRRGVDIVEFACGIQSHLLGDTLPEISNNVDSHMLREPLGVVAGITPFNFPAMIPLWMMPIAIACGNTFVLKPSEKCPLTSSLMVELLRDTKIPDGVVNLLVGGKEAVDGLLTNEHVRAVSFVGSSKVAEYVWKTASATGKRVQALGGAKNHLLLLPDADVERSIPALIGSCFGCAGQRCLAGSVLVLVGTTAQQDAALKAFVSAAKNLKLGNGVEEATTLPPVVNEESRSRLAGWIDIGLSEGAKLVLDGRKDFTMPTQGCFVAPSIFDNATPEMRIAREEIFGPVVVVLRASNLDDAISICNRSLYGNSASIFTQNGAAARLFSRRVQCGMLGINLGVPAPMSVFSFGGWKQSFFGDLHAYGPDAVEFYTRKKVVTERWFGAEAPKDGWV